MLGYVGAAFAWGFLKASAVGARLEPGYSVAHEAFGVLQEEVLFRKGLNGWAFGKQLGLAPSSANLLSASLFGLSHWDAGTDFLPPELKLARAAEAGVGGFFYGLAYQRHGLLGAFVTHLAHNLGCACAAYAGTRAAFAGCAATAPPSKVSR